MLGTIVNTATILIGGVFGSFLGTGIKEKYKKALFDALGLCCIVLGINASLPNMAKSEYRRDEKLQRIVDVFNLYREIIKRGDCLSVAELAIDGNDLLELGIKGPAVGEVLKACLDTVLQDPGNNNRTFLLEVAKDAARTAGEQPVC